jgi:hypothetical protein
MAVNIDLDLNANDATGKIGAIAASLKGLEMVADDIDIDFDADIGDITDEIDALAESLKDVDVNLNSLTNDIEKAAKELDGAEVGLVVDGPDGSTGSGNGGGRGPPVNMNWAELVQAADASTDLAREASGVADGGSTASIFERTYGPDAVHVSDSDIGEMLKMRSGGGVANLGEHSPLVPDYDARKRTGVRGRFGMEPLSMGDKRRSLLSKRELADLGFSVDIGDGLKDWQRRVRSIDLDSLNNGFSKMRKQMKKLTPSMGQYMQLLAAILPMMVTFAAQALGVAAALGAVGAAGASIVGMGLLGHGDSMAESFGNAQQRLQGLKRELFETFQPTMQEFAPISDRAFDAIPGALQPVAEEMEGLTVYEDTLFNLGGALAGGMEEAVEIIIENEEAISQLSKRFGGLIGSGLLDFFEWLIKEAEANQDLLVRLGSTFVTLAVAAYELSTFISRLVVNFKPLFNILAAVAGFLNNDFIVTILTLMGVWGGFILLTSKVVTALYGVAAALSTVGGSGVISTVIGGIARITGMLYGLVAAAWEANAALGVLAGLATAGLAVGAAAVSYEAIKGMAPDGPSSGAGVGGGTRMGGGGGTVINDNRSYEINASGNMDYSQRKEIEGVVKDVNSTSQITDEPSVRTESVESDIEGQN